MKDDNHNSEELGRCSDCLNLLQSSAEGKRERNRSLPIKSFVEIEAYSSNFSLLRVYKSKGFVQAWENGKETVPVTKRATMVDESNYLKQGIYRRGGKEVTILQDGLRVTAPLVDPPREKTATPTDPRDGITGPTGGTGSR